MSKRKHLSFKEISSIVNGLNPTDWAQMELLAKLPRYYADPEMIINSGEREEIEKGDSPRNRCEQK